jgi:hypothetical protein
MSIVPPSRLPWDFHPALRPERLRLCARLLVGARRDALALACEELGDDNWSVGCRAFSFGKRRLQRVSDSREHPWLRVLDGSHQFVFLIEDVPVRFFQGAADDAPERTLRRQEIEAQQMDLALGEDAAEPPRCSPPSTLPPARSSAAATQSIVPASSGSSSTRSRPASRMSSTCIW